MDTPRPVTPAGPTPVLLVSYDEYSKAQFAVDRLSDEGFPVSNVSIVWSGLRQVERVTGRRTVWSAAREGAAAGAWFGFLIGLMFATFATEESGGSGGAILGYTIVGAMGVAFFRAIGHWSQRGARDFGTTRELDAESYEVWVDPSLLARASGIIGVGTVRRQDPEPASDV